MIDSSFIRGIIPALITPMTEREEVDENGLEKLIDFVVEAKVHGIFVAGTAGEGWALSVEEKGRIYRAAVSFARGRVPVYAGTGANATRDSIRLSETARDAGVDALSVVAPSFVTPSQDELFEYFKTVAGSVDLPMLVYDVPSRTHNELTVDLVVRLYEACDNIVGIKDSTGDFSKTMEYLRRLREPFRYVVGNDNLILPQSDCGE